MSRNGAFSRAQQTKNWCVGFSFPPPAYAGIHPTLYLFGFRANALNFHALLCLALIRGLVSDDAFGTFWGFRQRLSGRSRPPAASGGSGGLRGPPKPTHWVVSRFFGLLAMPAASAGLQGPPGASGLGGLRGPRGASAGLQVWYQHFQVAWGPQAPPQQTPQAQGCWE